MRCAFTPRPQLGQWIRRAGEDVTRGAVVLPRGERLTPASLGLAASIGLARLPVVVRPRVALFSTGDELVMPGDVAPEAMPPGAIYNSNRFFLCALLRRLGCEVSDLGIVPDRRDATVAALKSAADHHDLILTSGGVSVGEEDHIKPAVMHLGSLDLWQIAMKPGKPFAHGWVRRDAGARADAGSACHFIGLPGNPVSSYITFLLLVRPFLLKLQGAREEATRTIALPAHFTLGKADKRREFLRVRRNPAGGLDLFPNQSSGVLTSAVWGDGVVDNPAGTHHCARRPGAIPSLFGVAGMKVNLRYFASIREDLGQGSETLETAAATLAALRDELIARGGALCARPGPWQGGAPGAEPGHGRRNRGA